MKKIFLAVTLLFAVSVAANAQGSFVVKAGLNFNKLNDIKVNNVEQSWNSQTGFHAGLGYQFRVPAIGLSFQPEVLYSQKRTGFGKVDDHSYNTDICFNNIEIPLNVQWGINILFLRPYIFAAPYLDYTMSVLGNWPTTDNWNDANRFDYGLSLGAGIELWKFQISGKYSWGFGKPFKEINTATWKLDDQNMKGFELSVAFLF